MISHIVSLPDNYSAKLSEPDQAMGPGRTATLQDVFHGSAQALTLVNVRSLDQRQRCSFQPLRVLIDPVEMVARLVQLVPPALGNCRGLRQQLRDLGLAQRLKTARRLQRLLKNGRRIAAGDDDAGRQV